MKGGIASFKKPIDMKMFIRAGLSRPHEPLSTTALVGHGMSCWWRVSSGPSQAPSGGLGCVDGNPSPVWKLPIMGSWNVPH